MAATGLAWVVGITVALLMIRAVRRGCYRWIGEEALMWGLSCAFGWVAGGFVLMLFRS